MLGLAFACGLGGGLLRDLLLAQGTPVALTDALYLPTVILAAIVSLIAGDPGPRSQGDRILDALAVGFFAVAGALRAQEAGVTVPAQLLIGMIGGSGGALLRDVLTARTPEIFRHGELNALAALAAPASSCSPIALARHPRWPSACSSASRCAPRRSTSACAARPPRSRRDDP